MPRIFVDILLILSLFIFPWWLVLILATIALFIFPAFYEILFLGVLMDSLYNAPIARFHQVEFVVTLVTAFLFVIAEILKRRLRFYTQR
jgi:hypothetical protein